MTIRTAVLLLVGAVELLIPFDAALASDWKYAGHVGKGSAGSTDVAFYDADSVKRDGTTVRYWVKTIAEKTLEESFTSSEQKKSKELVDEAARKHAAGYVPPLLMSSSLRATFHGDDKKFADFLVTVVGWEVAANRGARMTTRVLFEIDCSRKAFRPLEGVLFDEKENVKRAGTANGEWRFIAPDTNVAWISEVLCSK